MSRITARAFAKAAQDIFAVCDAQGREPTLDERREIQGLLDRAEHERWQPSVGKASAETVRGLETGFFSAMAPGRDPGSRLVQSEAFKKISGADRGKSFTTGMVQVSDGPRRTKGTVFEGAGAPGSGSGGGFVPVPQMVPGVAPTLFQPLSLEGLLSGGQASTNSIRFAVEGTATSGAAGVAEGGLKPESEIGVGVQDEPIRKVATSLAVSDELIEDAPACQAFVNGRLSLFINIETERQLLRGTASGNEVQGLLTGRNVPVYQGDGALDDKINQLFRGANSMRGSASIEPEWFIVHPTDWEEIRLRGDGVGGTTGQYLLGGPGGFGPYGGGAATVPSGQITGVSDTVWGKPVDVSSVIGAGTALVGTRANACVWSRGGLAIEITNSHQDYFVYDLIAMRAERRVGLTLYQKGGYCEVRFG